MEKNVITKNVDGDVAKIMVVGNNAHLNTQLCVLPWNVTIYRTIVARKLR